MNILLEEEPYLESLQPFTCTRDVSAIRIGIFTLAEKWEKLGAVILPITHPEAQTALHIPANIIPTTTNFKSIIDCARNDRKFSEIPGILSLEHPWQIFQYNEMAVKDDFILVTQNRVSASISETNSCIQLQDIFVEPSAKVEHAILNATQGPIYIGENAEIMEGSLIRGPVSIGNHSVVKMGTKIYGATSIGPSCVVGGEIKNAVLFGYSNKAHDGYLGDSVIGEWCNLGAGTSNSNVKNTAGMVKYRIRESADYIPVGIKGGLLMGDFSRAAINTSFNTGSVVGVCCNIFAEGLTPDYTEHFTWGRTRYDFNNALRDINNWMQIKGESLQQTTINKLTILYDQLKKQ